MHLHEEYIRRHNLNVPVVCYDKRSSVFLRSKNPVYSWCIFNVAWHDLDQSRHPGIYEFKLSQPIHNSFGDSCFRSMLQSDGKTPYTCRVFWDEYYDKVMELVALFKSKQMVVVSAAERTLAAWQMFLTIYDGWLASNMRTEFYSLVEQSTRMDFDFNTRNTAFRKAYKMLSIRSSSVAGFLEDDIMCLVRGHAPWLERLING